MSSIPQAAASSTTYWMAGRYTTGSISLGTALVTGRKRVPRPAAGITALRTLELMGRGSFRRPSPAGGRHTRMPRRRPDAGPLASYAARFRFTAGGEVSLALAHAEC